jgi:nucleoside-diphosphate-sugar epimerase
MYGRVQGAMKEDTPYHPSSIKGEVRAKIAEKLMNEVSAGNIRASIARAADFYGAESLNSFYDSMVLSKYAKKSKAMWLGNPGSKHSFTYVPDAGKAVALIGTHPETDNQIWHLPTAPAITGKEFIQLAARIFNTSSAYMRVNKLMLNTIGLFNKMIGETSELYYQYEYDYIFDSRKFEDYFKVKPTPYADGVTALSQTLFRQ